MAIGLTATDMGASLLDQAIGDLISGIKEEGTYGGDYLFKPEPFYGRLLASFRRIVTYESKKDKSKYYVPTGAVMIEKNQITLIVNEDFFAKYDRVSRAAVIKHEAQHIAHRHLFRFREGKYDNMQRANIAMDAVINQFNEPIMNMMETVSGEHFDAISYKKIPHAQPDGSWMKYYELIQEDEENNGTVIIVGDDDMSTAYGDMVDSHEHFGTTIDDESNPDLVEDQLKDTIRKVARQTEAGNNPGEIQNILDEIARESKIPWNILLRNWMKQSVRFRRDKNIMRESMSVAGVFPGYKREPLPEFHVYADMSGSVDDEQAKAFFNEVLAIVTKMKATVNLHQFDTRIHSSEIIDKKFPNIVRDGYGGTSFDCILEHAEENKIRNVIVMTDGYCPEVDWGRMNVMMAYTENHQEHPGTKGIVIDDT